MAEMPSFSTKSGDIYEDDFYVVTDDPEERMVNIAFIERGFVMRFDYEEFLEYVKVAEQARNHIAKSLDRPLPS